MEESELPSKIQRYAPWRWSRRSQRLALLWIAVVLLLAWYPILVEWFRPRH